MTPLTIAFEDLQLIRLLTAKQDQHAAMIGRLVIEQDMKKRLLVKPGAPLVLRDFGALQHEYEQRLAFFLTVVRATQAAQKAAGEAALQRIGIDPENGDYRIDNTNGCVLKLESGAWQRLQAN